MDSSGVGHFTIILPEPTGVKVVKGKVEGKETKLT